MKADVGRHGPELLSRLEQVGQKPCHMGPKALLVVSSCAAAFLWEVH